MPRQIFLLVGQSSRCFWAAPFPVRNEKEIDDEIVQLHNLGWLGDEAYQRERETHSCFPCTHRSTSGDSLRHSSRRALLDSDAAKQISFLSRLRIPAFPAWTSRRAASPLLWFHPTAAPVVEKRSRFMFQMLREIKVITLQQNCLVVTWFCDTKRSVVNFVTSLGVTKNNYIHMHLYTFVT